MSRRHVETLIRDTFLSFTPTAIILRGPNPLDPTTPKGIPLAVVGAGIDREGIDYPDATGWPELPTGTAYWIVQAPGVRACVPQDVQADVLHKAPDEGEIQALLDALSDVCDLDDDREDEEIEPADEGWQRDAIVDPVWFDRD